VFAVRPRHQILRPEFLAAWAASSRGKAYFLDCAKQTTNLASINSTQLKAFPVPIPSAKEQDEIVEVIGAVDTRLQSERHASHVLFSAKAALMAVLLTGELRVTLDEAAA
jgi:type I restriction enzyme S subunit